MGRGGNVRFITKGEEWPTGREHGRHTGLGAWERTSLLGGGRGTRTKRSVRATWRWVPSCGEVTEERRGRETKG
jgi:hypothetical protein